MCVGAAAWSHAGGRGGGGGSGGCRCCCPQMPSRQVHGSSAFPRRLLHAAAPSPALCIHPPCSSACLPADQGRCARRAAGCEEHNRGCSRWVDAAAQRGPTYCASVLPCTACARPCPASLQQCGPAACLPACNRAWGWQQRATCHSTLHRLPLRPTTPPLRACSPAVVPGAGAFEVAAARHLRTVTKKKVEGRAKLGVEAFAEVRAKVFEYRCMSYATCVWRQQPYVGHQRGRALETEVCALVPPPFSCATAPGLGVCGRCWWHDALQDALHASAPSHTLTLPCCRLHGPSPLHALLGLPATHMSPSVAPCFARRRCWACPRSWQRTAATTPRTASSRCRCDGKQAEQALLLVISLPGGRMHPPGSARMSAWACPCMHHPPLLPCPSPSSAPHLKTGGGRARRLRGP